MSTITPLPSLQISLNPSYTPSGPKSYASLLNKYSIHPTLPGKFYYGVYMQQQGKYGPGIGGILQRVEKLKKKNDSYDFDKDKSHKVRINGDEEVSLGLEFDDSGELLRREDFQGEGMWITEVGIGEPEQIVKFEVDFGGSDFWVYDKSNETGSSRVELFDPVRSKSFEPMEASVWSVNYPSNGFIRGSTGLDSVKFTEGIRVDKQVIQLVEDSSEEFKAEGRSSAGVLGLGWSNTHIMSSEPIKTLAERIETLKEGSKVFSVTFPLISDRERKGRSQDQSTLKSENTHYLDITTENGFYQFASNNLKINGRLEDTPGNTAILDPSTPLILLSDSICKLIYDKIEGAKFFPKVHGYIFPSSALKNQDGLPDVQIDIGGKLLDINKSIFGVSKVDLDGGEWSYGVFQSRGDSEYDILGSSLWDGRSLVFDLGKKRLDVNSV